MTQHIPNIDQQKQIREDAWEYYRRHIDAEGFETTTDLFGVEVELSIVDHLGRLAVGQTEKICNVLKDLPIVPEFGSYQIEINPPPLAICRDSFEKLPATLDSIAGEMNKVAAANGASLLPIGIPPYLDAKLLTGWDIYSEGERFQHSAEYFKNNGGANLCAQDGTKLFLPGDAAVTVVNELHVQMQARNRDDAVSLFNALASLTAPMAALGANSGACNGSALEDKDNQIRLYEECEKIFDGKPGVPRTGLFPGYIRDIQDYFDIAFSFTPWTYPENPSLAAAFELLSGIYYGWTRLRHGTEPTPHLRIEFRPLSVQPTMIENIALAELLVYWARYLVDHNQLPVAEADLRSNLDAAVRDGLEANLLWDHGDGPQSQTVIEIVEKTLKHLPPLVHEELILARLEQRQTPADRFRHDMSAYGTDEAYRRYMRSFTSSIPYIERHDRTPLCID